MTDPSSNRFRHPKANRLGGRGTFKAILEHDNRAWRGPIGMSIKPCDARKSRLGISIGRHVGNAARRNRIKRLLRESFRHMQFEWPRAFDVVILVKPHVPMPLGEYRAILAALKTKLVAREPVNPDAPPPEPSAGPGV